MLDPMFFHATMATYVDDLQERSKTENWMALQTDADLIARAAEYGGVFPDALEPAIERIERAFYGSILGGKQLPHDYCRDAELGQIVSTARTFAYPPEAWCTTQKEACAFLGRDRSSLRNYEDDGLLEKVTWRMGARQYLWTELEKTKTRIEAYPYEREDRGE